jgi:hypothetical protein
MARVRLFNRHSAGIWGYRADTENAGAAAASRKRYHFFRDLSENLARRMRVGRSNADKPAEENQNSKTRGS